jgi:hypothetical protein
MKKRIVALAAAVALTAMFGPGLFLPPNDASASRANACVRMTVAHEIVEEHGGNTQGIEGFQLRYCA